MSLGSVQLVVCVSKNIRQKYTCLEEFGLHIDFLLTILCSIVTFFVGGGANVVIY